MWLARLALLLLLLRLSGVLLVEGINTCQSINLDRQKSRRIEAVRGQILSKLRIRSPPDEDDEPPAGHVPPEVMLLYNSTRELLKERARQAESACERESSEEDYYAKEVQRIDMMPPRTDSSELVPGVRGVARATRGPLRGRRRRRRRRPLLIPRWGNINYSSKTKQKKKQKLHNAIRSIIILMKD